MTEQSREKSSKEDFVIIEIGYADDSQDINKIYDGDKSMHLGVCGHY